MERKERNKWKGGREGERENEAEEEGSIEGEDATAGRVEPPHSTAFMQKQVKVQERHANGKEHTINRKELARGKSY
jgi:hypothetical protein